MAEEQVAFEGWCVLELMGHRRLAGFVREQTIAGHGFLRLDIPAGEGVEAVTQFYSPTALYGLTPTTEEIAKRLSANLRPLPVHRFELGPVSPEPQDADLVDEENEADAEFGASR